MSVQSSQFDLLIEFVVKHTPDWITANRSALFEAVVIEQEIIPVVKNLTTGVQLGILQYKVLLSWERFPFRAYPPQKLFAIILSWLSEQGNDLRDIYELKQPEVDVERLDEDNAIVSIILDLAEAITIVEDETGDIPYNGKRWRLDMASVWVAEMADVVAVDENGVSPDPVAE